MEWHGGGGWRRVWFSVVSVLFLHCTSCRRGFPSLRCAGGLSGNTAVLGRSADLGVVAVALLSRLLLLLQLLLLLLLYLLLLLLLL